MPSLKHRLSIFVFAVGVLSLATRAHAACAPGSPQLIIYHAGSLTAAFSAVEQLFTQKFDVCVTDVAAGSRCSAPSEIVLAWSFTSINYKNCWVMARDMSGA